MTEKTPRQMLEPSQRVLEQTASRQSSMLETLIDISRIITTSDGLEETLAHTVERIAESLKVDVCSIYIHDAGNQQLELMATHGLAAEAVHSVRMPQNEGLTGFVFEQQESVNVRDVSNHPRFKYFPAIGEERLKSFLGVPLIEFRKTLGVLAIQNQEDRLFTPEEVNLLITIASQISGLVSKALLVDRLQTETARPAEAPPNGATQLQGVPIAPGFAKGKVAILRRHRLEEPRYFALRPPEQERQALQEALEKSELEILDMIREVSERVSEREAAIFHAHLLFLEDRAFVDKIDQQISDGASAAWAVAHVVKEFLQAFNSIGDPYLRERAVDLEDVGLRLLRHLGQAPEPEFTKLSGVLVTEMLLPSDTTHLDPARIKGIVTSIGGHVSHAAILARSLRIPAVSGIPDVISRLEDGMEVLLDGESGTVFVNPDENVTAEYDRYQQTRGAYLSHLDDLRDVPCATRCGQRIVLRGTTGLHQELEDCRTYGAEGIGLYRTEAFYLLRSTRPTVEELAESYGRALTAMEGLPVIFRTLDIGADRYPSYMNFSAEQNPYLGLRSIRYQLSHTDLLRDQITALLRVARLGDARLMFPMIGQLAELQQVKRIYEECREVFARETGQPAPSLPLGMVFEVPAAVLTCERFMGELDFASIGSNDLTQYVLAVDRNNPQISHLFDPLESAVLQMIQRLVEAAKQFGLPLELTGELTADPEGCLVLAGLGMREFSMPAPLIPIMKDRMEQYTLAEMESLAQIALNSTSAETLRQTIRQIRHS